MASSTSNASKFGCPQCGFTYAWDGAKCKHCRYPQVRSLESAKLEKARAEYDALPVLEPANKSVTHVSRPVIQPPNTIAGSKVTLPVFIVAALFCLGLLGKLLQQHPSPRIREPEVSQRTPESTHYRSIDSNSSRSTNKTIDDIHYDAYRRDMERQGLNPDMQREAEVRGVNKILRESGLQ